jgi:tetratricopeptide (TPR) repeat protein
MIRQQLQRAMILQQQRRHADAIRELRGFLAAEPHDAAAHAMLAISLLEENDLKDATAEAQQAVGLEPDLPFAHYALANVLLKRNHLDEAKLAAEEAIRLDSWNPTYFATLSAIEFERRMWPEALQQAENGLAIEPDNDWCTNLRAMSLVKLGRRDEATRTMGAALARDPENALSHANQGWNLLHAGDHKKARIHFREALRLDPELDWAKHGMVEALKSGFPPYRVLLMFWLWMARFSGKAQFGVIFGAWLGYQLLRGIVRQNPAAGKFLWPIMVAYVIFCAMTWLAYPLLNLVLRLHPFGKYALSREQVISSNWIGSLIGLCLLSVGLLFWTGIEPFVGFALVTGLLVMPVAAAFGCPKGWPRWVMYAASIVLAIIGTAATATAFHAWFAMGRENFSVPKLADDALMAFVYGVLIVALGSNWLRMQQPRS